MRVALVLFVLALACPRFAAAQGMEVGLKGGANLANLAFDDGGPETDRRTGPVVGVFVTLPVTGPLKFQPEVLYSAKGAVFEVPPFRSDVRIDYLEVPLLLRVDLIDRGTWGAFALAGPTLAYRLRARSRTSFSGSTEEVDIADEIEQFDAGVAAGGGVSMGRLSVEARYVFGLSNADARSGAVAARNRAVMLLAAYRF